MNLGGKWDYASQYVWETAEKDYLIPEDQIVKLHPGKFVSSKLVLLAAGPPVLGLLGKDYDRGAVKYGVYPMTAVENAVLNQGRQIHRLFEIGSALSYPIAGQTLATLNLSTAFHYGPNILNLAYAYYTGLLTGRGTRPNSPARSGDWYLNLASDLFEYPIGFYIMGNQSDNKIVGTFYLENCMISAHQMGINAGMVVLSENISIEVTRIRPVDPNSEGDVEDVYGDYTGDSQTPLERLEEGDPNWG